MMVSRQAQNHPAPPPPSGPGVTAAVLAAVFGTAAVFAAVLAAVFGTAAVFAAVLAAVFPQENWVRGSGKTAGAAGGEKPAFSQTAGPAVPGVAARVPWPGGVGRPAGVSLQAAHGTWGGGGPKQFQPYGLCSALGVAGDTSARHCPNSPEFRTQFLNVDQAGSVACAFQPAERASRRSRGGWAVGVSTILCMPVPVRAREIASCLALWSERFFC